MSRHEPWSSAEVFGARCCRFRPSCSALIKHGHEARVQGDTTRLGYAGCVGALMFNMSSVLANGVASLICTNGMLWRFKDHISHELADAAPAAVDILVSCPCSRSVPCVP